MSAIETTRNVDDELLEWSVHERKLFIARMMKPDGSLPDDPKEKALVLKAMDGIEKIAISRKRIKIEDKAATSQAEAARLIAHVFKSVAEKNPFVIDMGTAEQLSPEQRKALPSLPDDIPLPELVEGETAVSPPQNSYDNFMNSMGVPNRNA